jgi:hypothetical protein
MLKQNKRLKNQTIFYYKINFNRGQVIVEFGFAMIILMLMIYATMMIFRWTGVDLVGRRVTYDNSLVQSVSEDFYVPCLNIDYGSFSGGFRCAKWGTPTSGPIQQLNPYFYTPTGMNAIFRGK